MEVIVTTPGISLHHREGRLIARLNDEEIASYPFNHIETLICFSGVHPTEPVVSSLTGRGGQILFVSGSGRLKSIVSGVRSTGSVQSRLAQYRFFDRVAERLYLARQLVSAKVHNLKRFLAERIKPDFSLDTLIQQVAECDSLAQLRGIEGSFCRSYFQHLWSLFPGLPAIRRRTSHPSTDGVNQALSFTYTLLYQTAITAITAVGLDPFLGFFHNPGYSHAALASDIMETYRAQVVDRVVIRIFHDADFPQELAATADRRLPPVVIHKLKDAFSARLQTLRTVETEQLTFFQLICRDCANLRDYLLRRRFDFNPWKSS